jgi:hypothetical protein
MQRYLASLTIVLLVGIVVTRVLIMRIRAMRFGKIDKKDFFIPPFALFYFYIVFAAAFGFPAVSRQAFPFRGCLLVRSVPLPSGVVALPTQPGVIREEFSRWHRFRPSRQARYNKGIRDKSQSHLCCVLDCARWAVLGIP